MFFDHNNVHRGPTVLDTHQELISENISEEIYAPTLQNNEEMWKKFAIPTPPYSPETYTSSNKAHSVFNPHNLQVVPDDFPEDLSSDLPMVLSDAEMERLTSSTLANDCIWSEPEIADPNTMPAPIRGSICHIENPAVRESSLYTQKHYRDFHHYPQGLAIQENCMNQQHSPQNWSPYSGKLILFSWDGKVFDIYCILQSHQLLFRQKTRCYLEFENSLLFIYSVSRLVHNTVNYVFILLKYKHSQKNDGSFHFKTY